MNRASRRVLMLCLACLLLDGCKGSNSGGGTGGGQQKSSGSDKDSGSDKGSHGADSSGKAGGAAEGKDSAGILVGTVHIDPANLAKAGIRIAAVQVRQVPQQLTVPGQVVTDERHTDHLGARADGVVERVLVLPGDAVRAGQTLAWLHSHAVHETAGALAQAFAAVDRYTSGVKFAELNRDRYQRLLSLQAASQEEAQRAGQGLQQAQKNLADGQASVHMEQEHLSELLQVPAQSLTRSTLYTRELVPIRAETAGNVLERNITPGQVLTTGQQAFTVSNLSTVWVTAAVNETNLPQVHVGTGVVVTSQGYPNTTFHGTVTMLGDQLDPETRTVPVRIVLPNPGTRLRPGMFVSAAINEHATTSGIYIPEAAVQDVNGLQAVFVTADGANFAVRAVKLGEHSQGLVQVLEGLAPTDHIVVDGAFMVKGELLKGSVGEG